MTTAIVDPHAELIAAFEKIDSALKMAKTPPTEHFVDYAWHQFDVLAVIRHLSQPEQYYGQHRILLTGFWAWLASLGDKKCTRRAMILVAGRLVVDAEAVYTKRYNEIELLGDILFRLSHVGYGFHEQIYRPIGGLRTILQSKSMTYHKRSLSKRHRDVERGIGMVKLMHYFHHKVDKKKYKTLSITATKQFFSEADRFSTINKNITKPREMANVWSRTYKFLPLLYAADATEVDRDTTLLKYIQSGKISKAHDVESLSLWLGKANYIFNYIMKPLISDKLSEHLSPIFPEDKCHEFAAPPMPHVDVVHLERILKKRRNVN